MKRWPPLLLILIGLVLATCRPSVEPVNKITETISPTLSDVPSSTATASPTASPTPTVTPSPTEVPEFSFVVTSDMSHYSAREYINYPNFFAALLEHVKQFGPGDFMISTGDVIPSEGTGWTVDQVLGEDYSWFPLPGNHDFGAPEINFFETYTYEANGEGKPEIIGWGPDSCPHTTYSFDYLNAHFVALNVYCDAEAPWGIDGSVSDTVYDWLEKDLAETDKAHVFVFGHEPAFPQPDDQTGQARHQDDSLNQYPDARDRFWALLQAHDVVAYIHGHTHTNSAVKVGGIWELDAGQSMGVRAAPSPGTFLIIFIQGERVSLKTYRGEEGPGFSYHLYEELQLRP